MPEPGDAVVRRRIVVTGRVQGVGFRAGCKRIAEEAGTRGWVRNRPDGSVEIAAEGSPDTVDKLIEWCRRGPRSALVSRVDVAEEAPIGERGFRITF